MMGCLLRCCDQVLTTTLCFHREASKYLLEVLESVSEVELNDVIERILDAVEKQPCK